MEAPLITPEGTKFRTIREDIANICGDIIEAAILDLFEYWTRQSPKYKSPGTVVWMRETCEIIQKQLGYAFLSISTIQRKINSLVSKNLLLTKRNKSSRSPNAKYYALNTKSINEQILEFAGQKHGQTQTGKETQPDTSCKMNPVVIPSFILNNEVGAPSFILNVQSSFILNDHLYNYSFDTSQGNPPKPASSPLAGAIHPSPHPFVALEAGDETTSDRSSDQIDRETNGNVSDQPTTPASNQQPTEISEGLANDPVTQPNPTIHSFNSQESVVSQQQQVAPYEKSKDAIANCDKSSDTIANSREDDNRDQKKEDCTDKCFEVPEKYNSSARCDAKFNRLIPKGEWVGADRVFLHSVEGQIFLGLMVECGLAIERWKDFLWYLDKAANFEVWDRGYNKKTDVEKLASIRSYVKRHVTKPNTLDVILGYLEGFQSRLRLAEINKQQKQRSPQAVNDGRSPITKERAEAIKARVEAEKRAKLEAEDREAIAV